MKPVVAVHVSTHDMASIARFKVREVFLLAARRQFVVAGAVVEGSVQAGMHAQVWRDGQVFWSRPVVGVEFVDRPAINEAWVCLVFAERGHDDVEVCQAHCPVGTVVDVREGDCCA